MSFVTVTGRLLASHFQAGGEVPLTGQIFFTPTMEKVPTGEGVHLPAPMSVELDQDGRFEVELLSAGFSWEVNFSLRHAGAFVPVGCFNFLPEPGVERVNFADIVPLADPVTGVPMLRGEPGVGISSVSVEAGKLRVVTTDGQVTLLDLPSAGFDPAVLEGYTTKAELVEALAQFTPPETSPFTAGARYYSPVTYYWPDYYKGDESQWSKVLRFGENLGIVVMNRNSGDWAEYDKDFHVQAQLAKNAGAKRAVYYVKTQYGAAGNPGVWGAGVPDAAKYTKEHILAQLEYCETHYPDTFEGVFLDEFINGWGTQAERLPWYEDLVDAIRARFGQGFLIVGNCGSNCSEEVLALDVDVYMSFESTAAAYLADDPSSPIHPAHMAKQPGTRFWHVVHDVTPDNYQQVFAKAESLGIGHLYITDGRLVMGEGGQWQPDVNPYAVAPSQWIADLLRPWLRGVLDTRLRVEGLDARVALLEDTTQGGVVAPNLAVGEVQTLPPGASATAEVTGVSPDFVLSLGLPAGANGATPTITTGTVSTLPAGDSATADMVPTTGGYALNLGLPAGEDGAPGANGKDAPTPTLAVGTVSTGTAAASITGTAPNFVLNLTLPAGPKGEPGNPSTMALVGVGRPDTPATLSTANQTAVANAQVGATFTSTNGAGTGAWAWVKTPAGWEPTYADTGWRDITSLCPVTSGFVHIRRVGYRVSYRFGLTVASAGFLQEPTGFIYQPGPATSHYPANMSLPVAINASLPEMITVGYFNRFAGNRLQFPGNTKVVSGLYDFYVSHAWPSTLPGTPA